MELHYNMAAMNRDHFIVSEEDAPVFLKWELL